ncbi:putative membrane protein [Belliella pelovolcani]|uniref:Putative membrane protein n=2 Tax=Belliella pelovolcani TaxID=529505 RepID=A0A1N7KGZ0_9BACT|nr:putative membrane protein [Belliella pelovolcani]
MILGSPFRFSFMNRLKDYLLTYLKGMAMGAADIVPGVSGGSIALITGIYEKLLDSIKSFDQTAVKHLFKFEIKELWKHVNGNFLATLLFGILSSIFALSKIITYLIDEHPIPVWSFFCGLIIISAIIILRDIKSWSIAVVVAIVLGIVSAYLFTSIPPVNSPDGQWFTFVAGAVAICAMILPGVSGSFLLLMLGQYERILAAVSEKDLVIIAIFGAGCITGLLAFSRLISWLLKKYHAITIGMLSGFMLGSINKLWPWKLVLSYRMSSSGVQKPFMTENILPQYYLEQTGQDSLFLQAILAFSFGVLIVLGIERLAYYMKRS